MPDIGNGIPAEHRCEHPRAEHSVKSHRCTCDVSRDHGYLVGPIAKTFWGEE